jgi:drug/metabolite transporter (DMT)-like permease
MTAPANQAPVERGAPHTSPPVVPPHIPHTNHFLLYTALGVMMLIWSGNYPVAKIGFREIDGLTMGTVRVFCAALLMVPIYLLHRRRHPRHHAFTRHDHWTLARLGFFGMVVNQILFILGLSYTTVGHSSIIVAIGPVNILLLAWLMGLERLAVNKVTGIALSFAGVALLAAGHGFDVRDATLRGDLITLLGSFAFSLYAVYGKRAAGHFDPITMCAWNYFWAGLMLFPLFVWRVAHQDWSRVTWRGWAAIFYVVVASSVVAYFIWFWALRHLAASRIGVVTYIQPVLGTLMGIYALHEAYSGQLFLSAVLVLGGVALTEWAIPGAEAEDESVEEPE